MAVEPAEDVADGVDVNFQSRLTHQVDKQLAAAQLLDREHQPGHRAVVADTDTPDVVQIAHKAALVDGYAVSRLRSLGILMLSHCKKQSVSVFLGVQQCRRSEAFPAKLVPTKNSPL